MPETDSADTRLAEQIGQEIEDLRRDTLARFTHATMAAVWMWYLVQLVLKWEFVLSTLVSVVVCLMLYVVYKNLGRRLALSRASLLMAMVLLELALLYGQPSQVVAAFGAVVVVAAAIFLRPTAALAALAVNWVLTMVVWQLATGEPPTPGFATGIALLFGLVGAASMLAVGPLATSVHMALTGWSQARHALDEVQARRAELYRALRADEAGTYPPNSGQPP